MMVVVDSYDNEEDCKDDYVETEQQVMNVGGLCIYAASRLPCVIILPSFNISQFGGSTIRKPLHIMGQLGNICSN